MSETELKEQSNITSPQITLKEFRILVVDDDANTRDMLADLLKIRGANVAVAKSAAEARPAFWAWRPQVVISDKCVLTNASKPSNPLRMAVIAAANQTRVLPVKVVICAAQGRTVRDVIAIHRCRPVASVWRQPLLFRCSPALVSAANHS